MPVRPLPTRPLLLGATGAVLVRQALGFAALQRTIPVHRAYWQRRADVPGELLLAVVGDSVAQGIGASRPELGCISLVADRLAQATGRSVQVVNLSLTGARLDQVLDEQLPALRALGREPDLLIAEAGANDMIQNQRAEFESRLDELLEQLPAASVVADVPYLMHGRWERDAHRAAAVVRERARARGVTVVPIHQVLASYGRLISLTHCAADLFHPNDSGHRLWADALWTSVLETSLLDGASGARGPSPAAPPR